MVRPGACPAAGGGLAVSALPLTAELRVPGCQGIWRAPLSPSAFPGSGAHLLQLRLALWQLGRLLHGLPLPPLPSATRGWRRQYQEGAEGDGPPCCRGGVVGGCGALGGWHDQRCSRGARVAAVGGCQRRFLPPSRSPKCPSCCSQPTSSSSPPTPAASLSPPLEAPSTFSSCWNRGAANTCTCFGRPQVRAGGELGGCWGVPGLRVLSPLRAQRGVQGQACPPFPALGCVRVPPPAPAASALCLCHPRALTRAGERGARIGRGDVGPDIPWGWLWGFSCLTSPSARYSR